VVEPVSVFDRRVLLAIPAWDYGDPARGPSYDTTYWLPTIRRHAREVEMFATDRAMREPGSLDGRLLAEVDRLSPDLVMFFPYRDDVGADTLRALQERTVTAAFFYDDAWRFDDYSSRYARLYSHVITTEPTAVERYRQLGGSPILTQFAATPSDGPGPVTDEAAYRYDVTFVGGDHPWRSWLVEWLGRNGVRVECFGAGFANGRLSYAEMEEVFRTSRINLNLSNSRQHDTRFLLASPLNYVAARGPKAGEQIKARHFEIGMAGGCQLSYYAVGLEDVLRIGEEIAIYATPEDCLQQIHRLLDDPDRRMAIAAGAYRRCHAEHTYDQRVVDWLTAIWEDDLPLAA
jgi:spore maturation protein CgeB